MTQVEIDRYIEYLRSKLNHVPYCLTLMNNHRNWQTLDDYAFPYCKEIQELSNLSGRYNCGFRPLTKTKLSNYRLNLTPLDSGHIYLLGILSTESTKKMIQHNQYVAIITMDIFNYSYEININTEPFVFNQYDPIMSLSREFDGQYGYQVISYSDRFVQAILDDNLASLPLSFANYYQTVYQKSSQFKKLEEIRKMFPFMSTLAIREISLSESNSLIFYYCKIMITQQISQALSESLTQQSSEILLSIFPQLTSADLTKIFSQNNQALQYETICKIIQTTSKGLSLQSLIQYTTDYLTPQLSGFDFEEDNIIEELIELLNLNS